MNAVPRKRFSLLAILTFNLLAALAPSASAQNLSFIEAIRNSDIGGGLSGADAVTVSPDGRHVYVGALTELDFITVFERNAASGSLDFLEASDSGRTALFGASSVAVSPDGANVYVTGALADAVSTFSRDPLLGTLVSRGDNVDSTVDGTLFGEPRSVVVSPDGTQVFVAGAQAGTLAVFSRDVGNLGLLDDPPMIFLDDSNGVQGLDGASGVTLSPDGRHIYVAGARDNALAVFARDPATGSVNFVESLTNGTDNVEGLAEAKSVTVSPDGAHVYVAGATDNAVSMFTRDGMNGTLAFGQVLRDGVGGVDGLDGAVSLNVSPDGANVYVAATNDNAVSIFTRDPATGLLTFVEAQQQGVNGVSGLLRIGSVAVSPDGANLYAAALLDSAVVGFDRTATSPVSINLVASILPTSRSVQINAAATAFATIINSGTNGALGCAPALPDGLSATLSYQITDPSTNLVIGSPNTPANIPPNGAFQSFLISIVPTAAIDSSEIQLQFDCTNGAPVVTIAGVNTFLLSASVDPVADVIAIALSIGSMPGVVDISGVSGTGAFAVATTNVGSGDAITVAGVPSDGTPAAVFVCQTDPNSLCLQPPASEVVVQNFGNGQIPTFSFFVQGTGEEIVRDPANRRVFVTFTDGNGTVRGGTSVAVQTIAPPG